MQPALVHALLLVGIKLCRSDLNSYYGGVMSTLPCVLVSLITPRWQVHFPVPLWKLCDLGLSVHEAFQDDLFSYLHPIVPVPPSP